MISLASPALAAPPAGAQAEALAKAGFTPEWLGAVEAELAQRLYHFTPPTEGTAHARNREQGLYVDVGPAGIELSRAVQGSSSARAGMSVVGLGRGSALEPVGAARVESHAARAELRRDGVPLVEWYENSPKGIEQGFTLERAPQARGSEPVVLELALAGGIAPARHEDGVLLADAEGKARLRYDALRVWDRNGKELPSRMEVVGARVQLRIDDAGAAYPLTIDPLFTNPDVTFLGSTLSDDFGFAVATAGDVNGDKFSDVIIGAPGVTVTTTDQGQALIFFGGPSGPDLIADWHTEGSAFGAGYGASVASAGDLNNDGFDDVLVGEPWVSSNAGVSLQAGRWRAYLGGDPGQVSRAPRTTPLCQGSGLFEVDPDFRNLGASLGTAGDVNGDGFADVIVGAPGGFTGAGYAEVYLGPDLGAVLSSGTMVCSNRWALRGDQTGPAIDIISGGNFGSSVGTAGDVNGDGLDDVIVGAPTFKSATANLTGEGRAYVFLGTTNPSFPVSTVPAWSVVSGQANAHLGGSVGTAGDVNGDGFADVIVGAPDEDGSGLTDRGFVRVFNGGSGGLATAAFFTTSGGSAGMHLGSWVATVGDVNGDGFADVGATNINVANGAGGFGVARVFLGGTSGALETALDFAPSNNTATSGLVIAAAGDVNGDGLGDVLVGAPSQRNASSTQAGGAFLFFGKGDTLASAPAFAGLDFYAQNGAGHGIGLAFAGDIDHDGFADYVTGSPFYSNGQAEEGRFSVNLGGGFFSIHPIGGENEGNQVGARLGWSISGAGDVNGDGFDDVIIGAPLADTPLGIFYLGPSVPDAGTALVYYGSAGGLQTGALNFPTNIFPGNAGAQTGFSVAGAGDVDGDGCGDVIVGSPYYSPPGLTNAGRAELYLGCGNGPGTGPSGPAAWSVNGTAANQNLGYDVASAGDVNRDGHDDIIVGAPGGTGAAFVFAGQAGGLRSTPERTYVGTGTGTAFGNTVAGAGDLNGDGFSDVAVDAPSVGSPARGQVSVFYGSATGQPSPLPPTQLLGEAPTFFFAPHRFGGGLSAAGDVNGDGFGDLIVGDQWFTNPPPFDLQAQGKAYLFHGSLLGLSTVAARTFQDCPTSFCDFGRDVDGGHDYNGDGFPDVLIGAYQYQGQGAVFPHLGGGGRAPTAFFATHAGALVTPRQGATVGAKPLALRGIAPQNQLDASLFVRSAAGRTRALVDLETKPLGTAFNATNLTTLPLQDTGTSGSVRSASLTLPGDGSAQRWRARVRSRSPFFPASRWIALSGNAATEIDARGLSDADGDGVNLAADVCPFYVQTQGRKDTDGDGRGDECECGDQNGDGRNTVADLIAINSAIFNPALVTALCDANNDGNCNVSDIVAVNIEIFSPGNTSTCARQPVPQP